MKKNKLISFCVVISFLISTSVFANSRTMKGVSETEQLGISAGVALACKVDKEQLKNYEMIASRIISNPISSEKAEKEALRLYAQAKLKAYTEQKKQKLMNCAEVLARFEEQEIFNSVVYRDGTIKMPNGKVIKPKRPLKTKKGKK
ncbi:MAG: hypothetical protein J6V53_07285 [Alphaproteobacteria bacterium]|nr:hypothetical protein [Alphaproteobacteria bacterium]